MDRFVRITFAYNIAVEPVIEFENVVEAPATMYLYTRSMR